MAARCGAVLRGPPMSGRDVPSRPRCGSASAASPKSFTAAPIVQQVAAGRIRLDAPIGAHLPKLVPGARSKRTMVRMLLNHTCGMAEYLPSLQGFSSDPDVSSLDDNSSGSSARKN